MATLLVVSARYKVFTSDPPKLTVPVHCRAMSGERLPRRVATPVIAVIAAALLAGGCGDDTPSTPSGEGGADAAIVTVADRDVTKGQFDRAMRARSTSSSPLFPAATAAPPLDAPAFAGCVKATSRQLRTAEATVPSRDTLRRNCAIQYAQARKLTVSTLIQQTWIELQAAEDGIAAPSATSIDAALRAYRQSDPKGFARRLRRSGLTEADLRATVAAQTLTAQLVRAHTATTAPSDTEVKRFFEAHPELFGTPARRTLDVVVAANAADATQAKAALRRGEDVQDVIAGIGAEQPGRQGRFTVTEGDGQLPVDVEDAVFSAKRGSVVSPTGTGAAHYVVAIRSARPAKVPAFAKVSAKARQLSLGDRSQAAQTALQTEMEKRWRPRTRCAPGYLVRECGNGRGTGATSTTADGR